MDTGYFLFFNNKPPLYFLAPHKIWGTIIFFAKNLAYVKKKLYLCRLNVEEE